MIFIGGVTSVTGVVMEPLATDFGWTRALVTANIMICSVMSLLLACTGGGICHRSLRRAALRHDRCNRGSSGHIGDSAQPAANRMAHALQMTGHLPTAIPWAVHEHLIDQG
ncbi:hypothetical protein SAMN06295937_10341, partial [Sphingopyxis flava]